MNKNCKNCNCSFEITDEDLKFYDKVSPVFNDVKYSIPEPSLCPDCRQQRRLSFRNERNLYHRKCSCCSKNIISIYSSDSQYTIYCSDCWWNDSFDPLEYGVEFDFSKSFFEQFNSLMKRVPRIGLHVSNNENSDYINFSGYNKNSYLIFAAEYDENCFYGNRVMESQDCVDTLNCLRSQWCYEVVDVESCYNLFFSQSCKNCNDSMFLIDCIGCSDCLLSFNLRKQKYCIFNKQYTKEEYFIKKNEILSILNSSDRNLLIQKFIEMKKKVINKNLEILESESSMGNYLFNTRNCKNCFDISSGEDCIYAYSGVKMKDCMDVCHLYDAELSYEVTSTGYNSYNVLFSNTAWTTSNSYYVDNVHSSSDVFGCINLKKNKYCILNKQYTKEEYEILFPKIIEHMKKTGEWGEFFPVSLSPFGYNETVVNEYYPFNKEEALSKGYKWRDEDVQSQYQGVKYEVLENINDIQDDICNAILQCEVTGKAYKIIPQELSFYRKMELPIPKRCPDQRHLDRMQLRNPRVLCDRKCMKCNTDIKTTYSPERKEIVYCEDCYSNYIYN
jgi:hypothetical protein